MNISEYDSLFKNEKSHFFYKYLHSVVLDIIKKYQRTNEKRKIKICDAGCGTGLLAKKMELFGDVIGIDISFYALSLAKKRGIIVKRASVEKLPFRSKTFDVITSIDVLYHKKVKGDKKAVAEFFRVLKPGGVLIVRVPAHTWLYTEHDRRVQTKHRYSKREIRELLSSVGFRIQKLSYSHAALFPFAFLKSLFDRIYNKCQSSSIQKVPTVINSFFFFLLLLEKPFLIRGSVPFGIGIFSVAKKPE